MGGIQAAGVAGFAGAAMSRAAVGGIQAAGVTVIQKLDETFGKSLPYTGASSAALTCG